MPTRKAWIVFGACALAFVFWTEGELTTVLVVVASLAAVRLAVTRKVSRLMQAKSDAGVRDTTDRPAAEVASSRQPVFEIHRSTGSREEFPEAREAVVREARSLFRRTLLRDVAAAVAYLAAGAGYVGTGSMVGLFVGAVCLGLVVVRFLFYRRQFRAQDLTFEGGYTHHPGFVIAREASRPRSQALILGLVLASFVFEDGASGPAFLLSTEALALAAAIAFHAGLCFWLMPKDGANRRLLILRVFGVDRNATFTFDRLLRFWEHAGSCFTVVDTSFLAHEYRMVSTRTAGMLAVVLVAAQVVNRVVVEMLKAIDVSWGAWVFFDRNGFSVFSVIAAVVLIAFEYLRLDRLFVRSREGLRARLAALARRPRRFVDLTFRAMPVMCHDDTWKLAVSEFLGTASVVLMDLRGYSADRRGCNYEMDLLLDQVPVTRILFLTDSNSDLELIRLSILDRWRFQRVGSPNLALANPTLRIYVCDRQDETDVQGIYDQLIGVASTPAAVG